MYIKYLFIKLNKIYEKLDPRLILKVGDLKTAKFQKRDVALQRLYFKWRERILTLAFLYEYQI